jgi:hypothetical protein
MISSITENKAQPPGPFEILNARIDTLQREVAYQLAKHPALDMEDILSTFKEADKLALRNLDRTGVAYT